MPLSVRRFLLAALVVLVPVALAPNVASAQSTPENGTNPTLPVVIQNVSFTSSQADDAIADVGQATGQPPAQHKHHEGFGIGIKGGFMFGGNLSSLSTDSPNTGYQVSLFLGGNRPGRFGVATELTYIHRKANAEGSTTASSTLTAFEVPLLFRFNVGSANLDRASFYFMFGPALDVNLTKFTASTKNVDSFDVNLVVAGGVEITRFIVEFRYNKGLKNIANNFDAFTPVNTHSFVFMIGIRFN